MVVIPADLVKTTTRFTLGGTDEVAEFAAWGQLTTVPSTSADWDTQLANIAAAMHSSWLTNVHVDFFSSAVELQQTIAGRYDAAEHVLNEQSHVSSLGDWVGADTHSLPWQTTMCVNIYSYTPGTFIPNNRRRRGRVYLPPMGTSALANDFSGEMVAGLTTTMLGYVKNYFQGYSTTAAGWTLGVLSRVASHLYTATDLTTDDKFDTQRRRVKSEPATRAVLSY